MNKKILFISLLFLAIGVVVFKSINSSETEIDKLRKQHAETLKNHPFQKIGKLPKKERKAQGLPPNAYFEQKYLSEINPRTGKIHKENVFKIQEELNKLRAGSKVPGDVDNAWIERGPDNVGGRTRAVMFDPNDATNETVFAGGVSGGLWKNTNISNPDSKWVRVGVDENLAVSCIVADPNNPQIFYVGTGESYTNGDATGNGLWKSTDGGNSWSRIFGGVTGDSELDANSKLTISSPASIAKDYVAVLTNAFGGDITTPITNDLVLVDDGNDPTEDGCEAVTNTAELSGKIAVVRRGSCNFSAKAKNAQDAGAIAIIIVNNVGTAPFNMAAGTSGGDVTIPSLMMYKEDGDALIEALSSGSVNGTLTKVNSNATNAILVPGVQHINDIVIRDNGGVSEIYVAAGDSGYIGGASLGGDSLGLYKSIDGTNFTKLNIPKTSGGNEYEPNNIELASDNSIYFSTKNGTIFKSTDGINFVVKHTITNGLRTEIALSNSNTGIVYMLVQMNDSSAPVKIIKTTDDFATTLDLALPNDADTGIPANDFTRGQAFYDLLIKVDPNDQDTVYVGGIDLFKSTNGGSSWIQISHWYGGFGSQYVHADQHGLAFATSDRMVFSNDGGVYFSDNAGGNISGRNNNYNTMQFYTVGVAPTTAFDGQDYFAAGAQDNGTQLIENASDGINSSTIEITGGDGAATMFDTDGEDRYFITNYVYNAAIRLFKYNSDGTRQDGRSLDNDSNNDSNGSFINQEELDSNLDILYSNYSSGSNYIIRRYSSILSGTVQRTDLTNALMDAAPIAMKVSPYTTGSTKLLAGLGNGKLLVLENADKATPSWSEITGPEFLGSVSDIEFGANEQEIFVTMHNYGVANIWYSNDGGSTWKNKEGDFPDIPVKAILQNPLLPNEVIIGTDLGVWRTDNFNLDSPNWSQSYNGMSYVPVLDLDLRDDNKVFAATHGRGVFSGEFKLDPNGDEDGDGVLNGVDNCVTTANPDQADSDNNGIGDVCQDTDNDGVIDTEDNCPEVANSDQADSDNNGIGDVCQDTDNDGVMDNIDNCPETANADQTDANNNGIGDICDTSYANQNSISVETISETCEGEDDGKIIVNIKEIFVNYSVTLDGAKPQSIAGTATTTTYENLTPGEYEVCVNVDGRDYKQCFVININKAETVSLRAEKNQSSRDYTITMNSGTAPYSVYLNGSLIDTFDNSTFNVKVQKSGVLEVESAKKCEGKFSMVINNTFLKNNPVSDSIELLMPNDAESNINVTVFDVTGKLVLKENIQRQGNQLSIPFSDFKSGIYILKLGNDNTNTFKILK